MNLVNSRYAKLNDRNLVTIIQQSNNRYEINKASEALFVRYERQIHKNWLRLEAQLDHSGIVQAMKEDIDLVHMADVGSQLDVDGVEDQSLKGKSQPCDQQGDPKGIGGVFLFTQERHRNILSGLFRSYESSINQKHE